MPTALIVEDDSNTLIALSELVALEGFTPRTARSVSEAREAMAEAAPDVILSDLMLPDGQGLELLADLEDKRRPEVILITGHASVDSAIEALRVGVLDYLVKPVDVRRLKSVLANVSRTLALKEEIGTLRNELRQLGHFGRLIGSSQTMQRVYDLITKVSATDATVFLTGESGTGKEVVAQTIHELGRRRKRPFLPINCGAMPANLIESELFGHERGSFTGATQLHRGYFENASGGTLFLDEITEMPIELQVKLLRVLETGTLMRVGGTEQIPVDVRIIAATNRSPEIALKEGRLREDLHYRLNVFPLELPPLREREGDAELLADYFLDQIIRAEGKPKRLSAAARRRIATHHWPGNVRELKNVIHRAFILAENTIELDGLPASSAAPVTNSGGKGLEGIRVGDSLAAVERQVILATLESCGGDKKRAAEILGISLKTLYNRLNLYAAAT